MTVPKGVGKNLTGGGDVVCVEIDQVKQSSPVVYSSSSHRRVRFLTHSNKIYPPFLNPESLSLVLPPSLHHRDEPDVDHRDDPDVGVGSDFHVLLRLSFVFSSGSKLWKGGCLTHIYVDVHFRPLGSFLR